MSVTSNPAPGGEAATGLPDFSGVEAPASSPEGIPERNVMAPWGEDGPPGTQWRADILGDGYESRTIELLELPRMTFPILGLLVGRPLQDPPYRPRIPKDLAVGENTYPKVEGSYLEALAEYDEDVRAYYEMRKAGLGATNAFTQIISEQMGLPDTFDTAPVLEVLHSQGLCLN